MGVTDTIAGPFARFGAAAQNAFEVARFGGLDTGEEPSPFEVLVEHRVYRLRRYLQAGREGDLGPPIVLVPPMMLAAEVYDVAPRASAVRDLHGLGVDPWVVDFGAPEHEEGGLERDLADHVLAVSDAVDQVRALTGRDVHLAGYSQGGMFCYQTAAYRRNEGIASLIVFGSPVDTRGALPFGIPEELAARGAAVIAQRIFGPRGVPAWASRLGFRLLDPMKAVQQQVDFVLQLHDREALLPRERQRRFLQAEGWVAWPGPALADFMHQFVTHNRMLRGGFVIEDRLVTLADIDCPVLTVVGTVDEIAPPATVRAVTFAAPRADVYEYEMRAGHFGLVVGSQASERTWPTVAGWTQWRDHGGELPDGVRPAELAVAGNDHGPSLGTRAGYGLELASQVGAGVARSVLGTTRQTVGTLRELGAEAASQLPRLARLERVRPGTRVSLGLLLDEQAANTPEGVCFLFEDRAHTHAAAKHRIDSVVRGLVSLGVRQGEHVGVLMDMRPSALVVVAAINRLGAVAVLLRPDGSVEREAELGKVSRIIADPERASDAAAVGVQVLVLGGGAGPRDLGAGVLDMERIDPDEVALPAWYSPNPGRARDLAFVLFTGEGERTRVNRITNRRWALSAFGTASSAALSAADTVYSVTPIYHPSALLMSLGGAVAGGARIAMARDFDPTTFWEEVRRYGVTIVSYTWTMLREIVEAPPHPGERHHPVRLFIGSGMPRGLWRRVLRRFAPAGVLEFYASTQGEAILVNVAGQKIGSLGRPLPGSAEVRIAAYDVDAERLVTGPDGFARRRRRGDVGMLLARADSLTSLVGESPLRGVFAREDAWVATGDLFRCDTDGDYWLVDPVTSLIRTKDGVVSPSLIRDALGDLEAVDLSVSYGVPVGNGEHEIAMAAVTLCDGHELTAADVTQGLDVLEPEHRPSVVRVVQEIPVTTWARPVSGPLRREGVPVAGGKLPTWVKGGGKRQAYRELTEASRKRLLAGR